MSFSSLVYHIVFSTKDRLPLIPPDLRPDLWRYMGGLVRERDGVALTIGGVDNHIHMLLSLGTTHAIADMVRDVKAYSSRWMHRTPSSRSFAWQDGYAAFTVGVRGVPQVRAYIANQEQHHREVTFEDEFRSFLEQHDIEFDERYLWR